MKYHSNRGEVDPVQKRIIRVGVLVAVAFVFSVGFARADVCSSAKLLYNYARTLSEGGNVRLQVSGSDAGICQKYLSEAEKRLVGELVKEKGLSPEMAKREAMLDQAKVALYAAVQSRKDCEKLAAGSADSAKIQRDSTSVRH
ncbi:MAG: hypothetical protein KGO50_18290 [Myxococcales bacterium]|nr:hypothetical protein [Myxococcales bacterium]